MAKISDKDVAEVKLNQEKKFTGTGRQAFLVKFIPVLFRKLQLSVQRA